MKKTILTVIITAVICISGTVFAVSGINANQVTYTDTNNNNTTVNLALDNLYNNLDSKIVMNTFNPPSYNTSSGTAITSRSTSLNLEKGKYLILRNEAVCWPVASSNTNTSSSHGQSTKTLACNSDNCVIKQITGYYNNQVSGVFGSYKLVVSNAASMFYIEIRENTDTITASMTSSSASTSSAQYITLEAIPINE